ncbi:MAG: LemA family protein [Actinobacteria bacterium]|nr:LemA family protein [Actinomycetota bacterium]MCJ7472304.1 LemA family protein [Actinomycetota bacterium]
MGKKFTIGCVVAVVVVIVVVGLSFAAYIISSRNNMVAKEVTIDQSWAQVQNVYQRRLDLIPNLVESTKGYMQLEKDIFEAITEARAGINSAETPAELESATQELGSFIDDIRIVVEDTPELKASETVGDLMIQLEGSENRIAVERSRFNEAIGDYNIYIKMWPRNIIAGWFGFTEKEFFEAQPGAEIAPEVDLELD